MSIRQKPVENMLQCRYLGICEVQESDYWIGNNLDVSRSPVCWVLVALSPQRSFTMLVMRPSPKFLIEGNSE